MPRLSPVESERTHNHLSSWRKRRHVLLSPAHCVSKISNMDDHMWEMCDDYRTDRFSENYYRHYWGLHKAGMVLGVFFGMILVVSMAVGAAFIS